MITTDIKLNQVLCGKSEERLKEFPDNFFDGQVTDPPYELNFMGKDWDASGIACSVELWKEVLRTAKPGSFLLCFGGTRTYHRVACAIEDAGWFIKDQMMWIYGEGFPKSTNISKQIDKEAGAEREIVGKQKHPTLKNTNLLEEQANAAHGENRISREWDITAPATNDAKRWDGYGTGLKPGWEPIIVAMKPLEQGLTYAQNAKKWGVAGLNIDGGRIATNDKWEGGEIKNPKPLTGYEGGDGLNAQTSSSHPKGRWPVNLILSHSPDCVCVGTKIINEGAPEGGYTYNGKEYKVKGFVKDCKPQAASNRGQETIEVYACVPDCPIRIMDGQSGNLKSGAFPKHANHSTNISMSGDNYERTRPQRLETDSGGASRFFYCAKAKRSEKEAGLIDFAECVKCGKFNSETHTIIVNGEKKEEKCTRNNHPTVKPLSLMKYLCNLIKMPSAKENKQVILDPFCGSGTTLVALEQLGINYIGIDQDSDSCLTAIGRIGV